VHDLYGVAADRIRVIHNGIDLQQYRPTPGVETLNELGIDPASPFVLFVGRITRQKGIIHLVHALSSTCARARRSCCARARPTPRRSRAR
jgi:glycosyltransferase involved in cell wall biosynthesis